jgi:hypothetical protein
LYNGFDGAKAKQALQYCWQAEDSGDRPRRYTDDTGHLGILFMDREGWVMNEELKACPFCGKAHPTFVGRGIVYRNDDLNNKEVVNNYEHAITLLPDGLHCPFSLLVTTAEQWNTRPIEDALRARVAELEADAERLANVIRYGLRVGALSGRRIGRYALDALDKHHAVEPDETPTPDGPP